MSQVSRSKVLAAKRHRRAVARELADSGLALFRVNGLTPTSGFSGVAAMLCSGDDLVSIDVAAAREHALELRALADEQAVFEEWTQTKGRGPGNREAGAFDSNWSDARERGEAILECGECGGHGMVNMGHGDVQDCPADCYYGQARVPHRGGWPGKLAREWADSFVCNVCDDGWVRYPTEYALPKGRCLRCRTERKRRTQAPMGRALARLGQHILDALEGQPGGCQADGCERGHLEWGGEINPVCLACNGSGHNLRGTLPPIEWSPAVVVAVADCIRHDSPPRPRSSPRWTWVLYHEHEGLRARVDALVDPGRTVCRTRVCPRGEHRRHVPDIGPNGRKLHDIHMGEHEVTIALVQSDQHDAHIRARRYSRLPRWRRGELEHARTRSQRW